MSGFLRLPKFLKIQSLYSIGSKSVICRIAQCDSTLIRLEGGGFDS